MSWGFAPSPSDRQPTTSFTASCAVSRASDAASSPPTNVCASFRNASVSGSSPWSALPPSPPSPAPAPAPAPAEGTSSCAGGASTSPPAPAPWCSWWMKVAGSMSAVVAAEATDAACGYITSTNEASAAGASNMSSPPVLWGRYSDVSGRERITSSARSMRRDTTFARCASSSPSEPCERDDILPRPRAREATRPPPRPPLVRAEPRLARRPRVDPRDAPGAVASIPSRDGARVAAGRNYTPNAKM